MREKWIAVIGSSRRGKNTELIVDYLIEGLENKGIVVEKFILDSSNISTCTGCEACIITGDCIIKDDITKVIENMKRADGYIFATPSYNYNMSAQMKALLDRTFCLNDYNNGWKSRLSPGKKAIVAGVCSGKSEDAMGFAVEGVIKPLSELGIKIIDTIRYYNTRQFPVIVNEKIKEELIERINLYV